MSALRKHALNQQAVACWLLDMLELLTEVIQDKIAPATHPTLVLLAKEYADKLVSGLDDINLPED